MLLHVTDTSRPVQPHGAGDLSCGGDSREPTRQEKMCRRTSSLRMSINYNSNSSAQALGSSTLTPFLARVTTKLNESLPKGEVFNVYDYGCATGGSSIAPITAICDRIGDRKLRANMVDLPMNDWDVLRITVEPQFPDVDFVYKPQSMYLPIANEGTVHLGYSSYAQHWLGDGAPIGLPEGAMWANQLPPGHQDRLVWEESSKRDWETLLALRAREVVPGGFLVFHIQSSSSCGGLGEACAATMQQAKLEMIADGEISVEQARKMVVPEYLKSPTEILASVTSGANRLLWSVEELQYKKLPCPLGEDFCARSENDLGGDFADKIIKQQIDMLRAFTDSSLELALDSEQLETFWARAQRLANGNPKKLEFDVMGTFIVLKRSSVSPVDHLICA